MMLAYDRKRVTRDVDAIFYPSSKIQPLIRKVALEYELPEDWINDEVKQFLGTRESIRELPWIYLAYKLPCPLQDTFWQ